MVSKKNLEKNIFWKLFHNIGDQSFYWEVYNAALREMNYNCTGKIDLSGERNVMRYIFEKLSNIYPYQHFTIFDVGANIGNYTKELLNTTFNNCDITVHCFEPSPSTFKLLANNLGNNNNVVLNNYGLSDKCDTLPLFSDKPGSGMTSIYNRRIEHYGVRLSHQGDAAFLTLNQYCHNNNIEHIHFVKIDVEGHELKVLNGGQEIDIDYIQFEFGGTDIDSRTFFQDFWYLLHDKYKIFRILRDGLHEIPDYNEQLEIFSCTNYLAELKHLQ